jgi:predicted PurR-regulated permease PerM
MNAKQQALFWLVAAALLVLFLTLLGDILLPFVLGAAIAYFLDPLADRLERLGMSRFWATIVIVFAFALVLATGLVFLLPPLTEQLVGLAAKLPSYVQSLRDILMGYAEQWLGDALTRPNSGVEQAAADFIQKATGWIGQLIGSVWSGGMALVNTLALILVTPVVAFYLLLDWDRMMAQVDGWLPRDYAGTIRELAREIDTVLSGFVRGQITVLFLLGTLYVVGLTAIGLNFGLLIGFTAGVISFVPYVGPIVGFLIGGTVAIVQFGSDWLPIAGVMGVFLAGQIIEGNVLSPLIVGDRVGLHPVWLMFALFVFAYLFGFVGMLLAVPAAAAIGVLVRFALHQYLKSPLYYGSRAGKVSSGKKKGAGADKT